MDYSLVLLDLWEQSLEVVKYLRVRNGREKVTAEGLISCKLFFAGLCTRVSNQLFAITCMYEYVRGTEGRNEGLFDSNIRENLLAQSNCLIPLSSIYC